MKVQLLRALCLVCLGLLPFVSFAKDIEIALVVKSLGNSFFEAAYKGAQEAAQEIGGVRVIYTGAKTNAIDEQINVVEQLIQQGIDAIAISANHPTELVPVLSFAKEQGIAVISWDAQVAKEGRVMHLHPSSATLIGRMLLKLATDALTQMGKQEGDIAILTTTKNSSNQNAWLAQMSDLLKEYPHLNVIKAVYGDDDADKSYQQAIRLMNQHPNLDVIVAPTSVGLLATAQAIVDQGKIGQVYATGLGLPSDLAGLVKKGAIHSFAIWNPIDLGYSATTIAHNVLTGNFTATQIPMGRMGVAQLNENGEAAMAAPYIYDQFNVEAFSLIF